MMLLVDLGNTSIKWAQRDGESWHTDQRVHAGQPLKSVLDGVWRAIDLPTRIVVCSVASLEVSRSLAEWCKARWGRSPQLIESMAQFADVRNGYRDPAQLGADRWAALVAAREMVNGDVVVVDCGTAVTLDWLDARGEHRGGVIFPGLALQRASLRAGTGGIHEVDGDAESCLARSTADGVAAGTAFATIGAIERILGEFNKHLKGGNVTVLITGGNAEFIAPRLPLPKKLVPDLVLLGLKRIADSL